MYWPTFFSKSSSGIWGHSAKRPGVDLQELGLLNKFQVPEFIQNYAVFINAEVLLFICLFLVTIAIFIILVMRVRNLKRKIAALQESMQQLWAMDRRRSLKDANEARVRQQTALSGGFDANPAGTDLKLAVMETELKALKEMVAELRQARDDWKAQAKGISLGLTRPIADSASADTLSVLEPTSTSVP